MAASLAQRVMKLEQLRTDKNANIDILREQVAMQEKTIQAMNEVRWLDSTEYRRENVANMISLCDVILLATC